MTRLSAPIQSADTRARLIRAATRLLQQRGYHGVGLTEILRAAQAPKGSLYHHFPDGKAELAVAAIDRIAASARDSLQAMRSRGATRGDWERWLAAGTARFLTASNWQDGSLMAAMAAEAGGLPEAVRVATARGYATMRAALADWIMEADGGDESAALVEANAIIARLEGATLLARITRETAPLDAIARA